MKLLLLGMLALMFSSVDANSSAAKPACQQEQYRQFDFWVGHWDVYSRDGKKVGENKISEAMNGCVLKEHYVATSGYEGESLNTFDQVQSQWHQTWVDNSGLLLQLDGHWNGHNMTLMGEGKNTKGQSIRHRIVWKPQKNGDVHQVWDISEDNGVHWTNAFFGVYKKRTTPKSN